MLRCDECGAMHFDIESLGTRCRFLRGDVFLTYCEGTVVASPPSAKTVGYELNREWSPGQSVTPWMPMIISGSRHHQRHRLTR